MTEPLGGYSLVITTQPLTRKPLDKDSVQLLLLKSTPSALGVGNGVLPVERALQEAQLFVRELFRVASQHYERDLLWSRLLFDYTRGPGADVSRTLSLPTDLFRVEVGPQQLEECLRLSICTPLETLDPRLDELLRVSGVCWQELALRLRDIYADQLREFQFQEDDENSSHLLLLCPDTFDLVIHLCFVTPKNQTVRVAPVDGGDESVDSNGSANSSSGSASMNDNHVGSFSGEFSDSGFDIETQGDVRVEICRREEPPNKQFTFAQLLASPVAVGDVLVAFDLQSEGETMQSVQAFDQLVTVLRRAQLPVTLRFKSREKEVPSRVEDADVVHKYVFTWASGQPLGVSLAMDPCSLHAAITAIDPNKISPAFQNLKPVLGDVLVSISADNDDAIATRLDEMRFEDIIQTLRGFERPCRLTFARFVEETPSDSSGSEEDGVLFPLAPINRPKASSSVDKSNDATDAKLAFLMRPMQIRPKSRSRAGLPKARKQMPISMRQSFRIDAPKPAATAPAPAPSCSGRPHSGSNVDDKGFYTVTYSGGAVGLQLRDCTQDDKKLANSSDKTNRTNGYTVAVRNITDAKSAPGLENASADDLLMAIGQKDLQNMSFDQVRNELAAIQTPTTLLFKKRKRITGNSVGSSLVDSLMLFLM
ncbi:hypothetical protein BBJ29_002824 [Phytophthora kernoviae]|uniref:PDZ domain-containing protein n=1 Tax=Phytophthora kernoviae TaxID=325452 RepID=A0A3F2RTZ0_9STRA|nr:hypothetical protein BBJ29_002824 [Phytophthora kernoviae]RLN63211.1 hypothetical protein BBP00_00004309 [Phytophthora kernoviae]